MQFLSRNTEETAQIAGDFGESLVPQRGSATVIGLYGELGAGKTTFMKSLAKYFGIKETIQSPTFVILKRYEIPLDDKQETKNFSNLIHIDAYRIEKEEEMKVLGWGAIISDPQNLICVEWPERISGIIPSHIKIFFKHISQNEREISIDK